ncbi:hypothetical protein ACET3Z_005714 [Daucus carota]
MDGVDNFARLSSLIEAYTRENASLNATEPTTHPLSINEMSQAAPKTYNFCQVCGVQGHYGYECSYNVFNSQNAQLTHVNDYQERYEYNHYSNSCDRQWMDQPDFSYMDNEFQDFSYHDQQQFQQHHYEEPPLQQYDQFEQEYYQPQYEQPQFQRYHYSPYQQDLQVPLTNVDVPSDQTNEVCDMLINMTESFEDGIMNFQKCIEESTKMIKELKAEQVMMEVQIAQLASSSTTWKTDSSPPISIQVEDDINTIIFASDEECNSFSICDDDAPIDKGEDHVIANEIDDVVDHVRDDEPKFVL